jgi:hypothetical protein
MLVVMDKRGKTLDVGDEVDVDEPRQGDLHNCGFRGRIIELGEDNGAGKVTVVDQDDEAFDVDADQVTLVED